MRKNITKQTLAYSSDISRSSSKSRAPFKSSNRHFFLLVYFGPKAAVDNDLVASLEIAVLPKETQTTIILRATLANTRNYAFRYVNHRILNK